MTVRGQCVTVKLQGEYRFSKIINFTITDGSTGGNQRWAHWLT